MHIIIIRPIINTNSGRWQGKKLTKFVFQKPNSQSDHMVDPEDNPFNQKRKEKNCHLRKNCFVFFGTQTCCFQSDICTLLYTYLSLFILWLNYL